jgi:hypothetical protein
VHGRVTVGAKFIAIQMIDAPAPVYRTLSEGDHGIDSEMSERPMMLSDYASDLNAVRPFYGPLSPQEREPMDARVDELFDEIIEATDAGRTVLSVLA